jgi:hypothetical protein
MFVMSESLSNTAHVYLIRVYLSIFKYILRISKEFICQVLPIGHICLSINSIKDMFTYMSVSENNPNWNTLLTSS